MILTSTVKIKSKKYKLLPVKTDGDISHAKIAEAMAQINKIELCAPVKSGQILVSDFIESGINLVASKTVTE